MTIFKSHVEVRLASHRDFYSEFPFVLWSESHMDFYSEIPSERHSECMVILHFGLCLNSEPGFRYPKLMMNACTVCAI